MEKNNWNIFKRTQAYLKPFILPYLFFVVISGAGQFLTFSSVGVFLKEILLIVNGSEQNFTFQDGLLYLLATFLFTCMMGLGIYNIKKIEQKVKVQMRDEMMNSYMHADEKMVENITTKDIMNRMSMDLTKMADLVGWIMAGSIYMPVISGICSVIYLYFIDYRIALVCLLLAIIQYFLLRLFPKRRAKEVSDITGGTDGVIQFVNEEVDGIHEIHSFHLNDSFLNRLNLKVISLNKHIHCYNTLNSTRLFISGFYIQCICEVILLVVGAYLASIKIILFANIMIAIQLSDQIEQMIVAFASFKIFVDEYSVYEKRVYEIIDLKKQESNYINNEDSYLSFNHVCFSYNDIEILHDISFDIEKNKKIAIVGESGSGKSTIIKLLLNLYKPDKGSVNKKNDITISYMPQTTTMFLTKVSNNISLNSCPDIDRVKQASIEAGADEFIGLKEEGYEYVFSDEGYSGGERERISLARTLYKDSDILVFDEPTSALDEKTEKQIKQTIEDIHDKTVVVITHRLSFVEDFDEIIVIDKGNIKEMGTHKELMKHKDHYYDMYQLQHS